VRHYGCQAGINITASHNPKEYNGYKVYWSDGAQLPPQHADAVARQMDEIDIFTGFTTCDYDEAVWPTAASRCHGRRHRRGVYGKMSPSQAIDRRRGARVADTFKIVYTPFHGCGYKLVPEALKGAGHKASAPVPEQMVIDGTFPTVESPNPENPEGFYLAVDLAKKTAVDFIIGTDPDSDRVGVMVRDHAGRIQDHHRQPDGRSAAGLYNRRGRETAPCRKNAGAVKSIVTTEMAREVCVRKTASMLEDTFTGFKFMAEKKNELESRRRGQGHLLL
jgi:phosphoglucomutase